MITLKESQPYQGDNGSSVNQMTVSANSRLMFRNFLCVCNYVFPFVCMTDK